ncbi:MAG TPA: calcium-binding protein, partial [Solirubrobacteraceae bacterium]|nr:calcium-binding protein [Solirubrobacteraceae bacterium]
LSDGVPDFVIPARSHDIPLKNPDPNAGLNVGAAYLYSGSSGGAANGVHRATIVSPEPQIRSQFSGNFNAGRAVGDLGATTTPDILLPAPMQNVGGNADEGKAWILNGDTTAGGGGEQSWNFSMLNDPEPYIGGNFGGGITGVGDLVSGLGAPANEVLIGGFRFDNFTEASQNVVPDVNFMNGTLNRNLMTIPHPEGKTGDGFGVGITPMGDLNDDGFLDFSVSAYFADLPLGGQGRAWIFKSDNSPLPPAPRTPAPEAEGPTTPQTQGEALRAGSCTNRMIGTDVSERLMGSLAGDEIFGFGGNDTIRGFAGRDCIDGQAGDDALRGDDDNDKVIGGSGADRVSGGDDRDELFGGSGSDRLDGDTENDMIAGGFGNDRVLGSAGNDRLFGEAGTDRILGGGGRNIIDGGTGNDSIDARNGERDRIACGTGRDRVRADRFDRLNSCEKVSYGGKITNRGALPPRTTSAARARSANTSGNGETSR